MPEDQITVAEWIANFIASKNSPAVFQLSGGMIAFLTDAITSLGKTKIIHNRNEQGSGFAAEGATRVTGIPSVAMGTSGPGATNLLTPLASCYFDSVPVIFLTGQVNTKEIKLDRNQRQNGFQELDICEIARSITKFTTRIESAADVPEIFERAWGIAMADRPGPVLLDIPIDIQQSKIPKSFAGEAKAEIRSSDSPDEVDTLLELLENSVMPLVLIGGGVRCSNQVIQARNFLQNTNLPFVASLLGLDSVDQTNENYLGFIGSYGNSWANRAITDCDLLLVLGSRLDGRQTGPNIPAFQEGKKIIRIDIDDHELNGRVKAEVNISLPLGVFFDKLGDKIQYRNKSKMVSIIQNERLEMPQWKEQNSSFQLNPSLLMEKLSEIFQNSQGYLVDVGQHQMWAAQSLALFPNQRFITSGGLGSMGFSLPAAIGAATTQNGHWVVIIGDGCLQLSAPELQTIAQYKLNLTICVINNSQHGMVAQFQDEYMEGRKFGTKIDYTNPNYELLAKAHGIENYCKISILSELANLPEFLKLPGPSLVEFVIDEEAKALPKLKYINSSLEAI